MTVEGERFISEMLKSIRTEMRETRDEVINLGLRMTAVEHQLLGVNTHLADLQHIATTTSADMRRVKQRLELADGEA